MRFLIDECLSPTLAILASDRGHDGSETVSGLKLRQATDAKLADRACEGGWVLVTRNAYDFRGKPKSPGLPGIYALRAGHPGLICLNADGAFRRDTQLALFLAVLRQLQNIRLVQGKVIEATMLRETVVDIVAYPMPG